MLSANYHKGKCWVGCSSINSLERASFVPPQCRWRSFLRAISPCNRVGNVEHGSCRIPNAVVKQLNEAIKGFIETGAWDLARAAREAGKALVLELHKILDEVKNVPHAERLAPRPTKAVKFDITGGKMFFQDSALHARVVAALRDKSPEVAFGGVEVFYFGKICTIIHAPVACPMAQAKWLTQEELKDMEYWCDRSGEAWGELQWGVSPWVHWAVMHSAHFALWFGKFVYLPQFSYGIQEPTVQKATHHVSSSKILH